MLKENPSIFLTLCIMSMLPTTVATVFMGFCAVNGQQIPASLSAIAGATGALLPLLIMAVKNGNSLDIPKGTTYERLRQDVQPGTGALQRPQPHP